jgi:hypothetical protein
MISVSLIIMYVLSLLFCFFSSCLVRGNKRWLRFASLPRPIRHGSWKHSAPCSNRQHQFTSPAYCCSGAMSCLGQRTSTRCTSSIRLTRQNLTIMSDSTNTTGEVPVTILDPAVAALAHEYPQAPTELLRELVAYRNALPLALGPSSNS